jgi:alkyl hydroperoxide reductase subunit AhpF
MVSQTADAPVLEPGHPGDEKISGPIASLLDSHGNATGIRFIGIPSGHEFGAFLEDIKAVSTHEVALSDQAKEALSQITHPVHIQVFTTPT